MCGTSRPGSKEEHDVEWNGPRHQGSRSNIGTRRRHDGLQPRLHRRLPVRDQRQEQPRQHHGLRHRLPVGALSQLADSPIPAGRNPVSLVAAPNGQYLYVLNHDDSTVVEYTIGTDGKIYAANTYNVVQGNGLIGTFPVAAAIDAAGAYLYVAFTYQNGFTTLSPGPGGVAIFPIHTDGTLGAALTNTTIGTTAAHPLPYIPVGDNPTAIVATQKGNNVYVIDDEFPANASQFGVLLAFNENTSTGALTPVTGTVSGGFSAGTQPSGIAADPTGRFLYVTDSLTNQMYAYNIQANGTPVPNISSPFTTGSFPMSVTVDPRGTFVYVANFTSSTVSAYVINTATGALSGAGRHGQRRHGTHVRRS